MADAVINSSPLIFFSRGSHANLLRDFTEELLIPSAVADEILRRGKSDPTAILIEGASWMKIVPVESIPMQIAAWGLGAGESAVLALARELECEAIIDDLAGRRCAASLGDIGSWDAGNRPCCQATGPHPQGAARY